MPFSWAIVFTHGALFTDDAGLFFGEQRLRLFRNDVVALWSVIMDHRFFDGRVYNILALGFNFFRLLLKFLNVSLGLE